MLESSDDVCSLGVSLCFLSVETEMSDGFRQQDFRVCGCPWKAQHPLTGDGIVLVPIHRVFLLQVHDLLIQLKDSKCWDSIVILTDFLVSKPENREELITQGKKIQAIYSRNLIIARPCRKYRMLRNYDSSRRQTCFS